MTQQFRCHSPNYKPLFLFINLVHAAKQCSLCNLCSLVQWLIMVVNFLAKVSRRNQLISMASLSFSRLVRSEGCSQLILKLRHAKQGTKGWNLFCKKNSDLHVTCVSTILSYKNWNGQNTRSSLIYNTTIHYSIVPR